MVKVSSPGTVSVGSSTDPGHGALSSPHGEVPDGSPILTDPTLPRPESVGSSIVVVLPALFPVPRPLVVSKSSSRMTIVWALIDVRSKPPKKTLSNNFMVKKCE